MDKIFENSVANTFASIGAVICGVSIYGAVLWDVSLVFSVGGLIVGAVFIAVAFAVHVRKKPESQEKK